MNGQTFEIVTKKLILGCCWKDVELQREALIDLEQFAQEVAPADEHPVIKKLAAEKKAAEEAGKQQELFEQWYQEVLPYIWCEFKHLYKYFGEPEVQPLWQRYPAMVRMSLNTEIACLEQAGPLIEEEISRIVRAMKESIGHEKGIEVLYDALGEVAQRHLEQLPGKAMEG